MKIRIVKMVLTLIALQFISPLGFSQDIKPGSQQLWAVSEMFYRAHDEQVPIYAPLTFEEAQNVHQVVLEKFEAGEPIAVFENELRLIVELLSKASAKSLHSKEVLDVVGELRRTALDVRASHHAPQEFNGAEALFRDVVIALERDDAAPARELASELENAFRIAIIAALSRGVVQQAKDKLSVEMDKVLSPTIEHAMTQLEELRDLLENVSETLQTPSAELVPNVGSAIAKIYKNAGLDFELLELPDDLILQLFPGQGGRPDYQGAGTGGFTYPKLKVSKTSSESTIAVGQYTTVTIKVTGSEVLQSTPPPLSLVLALDESGSMKNDYSYSRAAAKAVIQSLTPTVDKVALVTFSTNASTKEPLTTNHQKVIKTLDNLGSPSGLTNLKGAFDLANNILKQDKSAFNKIVILFTDGMPQSSGYGIDFSQLNYINDNLDVPKANNIQYFTVSYGKNTPKTDLKTLAKETGGKYYDANKASDLVNHFTNALASLHKLLKTRNVKIREYVNKDLVVKPGSFTYSSSEGYDSPKFKKAMQQAAQAFYNTGSLTVPTLYLLDDQRTFSVGFDVTAKSCKPKQTAQTIDKVSSHVEYGPGGKLTWVEKIPQKSLNVKPCGVYLEKTFNPANRLVEIKIRNTFNDRSVHGLYAREITGKDVEPLMGTVTPNWPIGLPWYPSNATDAWKVYGIEWKVPYSIPPNTTRILSYNLKVLPSAKNKEPGEEVVINPKALKMLPDPDLGTNFPGYIHDTQIKYWYKGIGGKKVQVDQPLPYLSWPGLKPQWPYE